MAFDWPAVLEPQDVAWIIQKAVISFRSQMSGSQESIEFPGEFWKISVTVPPRPMNTAGVASAFFARVAGGMEQVNVPYWPRRVPIGTMRGSPVLAAGAVRGDLSLQITTTGTLVAGDAFSVGGQLFVCFQDCAPVSGTLTVPLVNRVKATYAIGTAVVWDKPVVKCTIPANSFGASYLTNIMAGLPVDLEEV